MDRKIWRGNQQVKCRVRNVPRHRLKVFGGREGKDKSFLGLESSPLLLVGWGLQLREG